MCGIVGYIGDRAAAPILMAGLKRLEYRGYDSAGLAVLNGNIHLRKRAGRLSSWERGSETDLLGNIGIAHTRWATHGAPTNANAHPHFDCTRRLAIVHNGIIENYQELQSELLELGHRFDSETDSEVIAHLIESYNRLDLLEAVKSALQRLVGSYALVVLSADNPDMLIAARQDSPLIIGLAEDETFLASDIPAILNHTRECLILQDGEMACVNRHGVEISKVSGESGIEKQVVYIDWESEAAEKGGFTHFMLKEIYEQPKVLTTASETALKELQLCNSSPSCKKPFPTEAVPRINQVHMVACGTAYHAALLGKEFFNQIVGLPVQVEVASEFRYRKQKLGPETLCLFISQSGETADTLAALREAMRSGALCMAIVNVVGSSIAREADYVLYTNAGPEIAVASTKAYISQVVCLLILARHLGCVLNGFDVQPEIIQALKALPNQASQVLKESRPFIQQLSLDWSQYKDAYFIGRGLDYPLAMEGQLKLKEISYIHAEALPAGELKHGTLALITQGTPVIALATQPLLYSKMISNIREVGARGADILGVTQVDNTALAEICRNVLYLPKCNPLVAPILGIIPLQLLAYEMAAVRGCDIDKPRNLAKSVTVE